MLMGFYLKILTPQKQTPLSSKEMFWDVKMDGQVSEIRVSTFLMLDIMMKTLSAGKNLRQNVNQKAPI